MPYVSIPATTDAKGVYWYHSMDLGSGESVIGDWDLRDRFREYSGALDFRGKTVLDVGTASGFLAFEAERAGGNVISLDMPANGDWDVVPYALEPVGESIEDQLKRHLQDADACKRASIKNLRKGFYYAHTMNQSKVRLYESSVYTIGEDLGFVDVAIVGSILLHLRDPFKALHKILSVTKSQVVISDLHDDGAIGNRPTMEFLPNPHRDIPNANAWWRLGVPVIIKMLDVLGFECQPVNVHSYPFKGTDRKVFTLVGTRVRVPGEVRVQS